MICVRANSLTDTEAVAAAIAPMLTAGDCVLLAGDMGSGKTTFTRALAAAAGVAEPVISPTFTLVHSYRGSRVAVHHADVYRLERMDEVADLAFDELLDDGVLVVEWGDAVRAALPTSRLEVSLAVDDVGATVRHIDINALGSRWERRERKLADALAPWCVPC